MGKYEKSCVRLLGVHSRFFVKSLLFMQDGSKPVLSLPNGRSRPINHIFIYFYGCADASPILLRNDVLQKIGNAPVKGSHHLFRKEAVIEKLIFSVRGNTTKPYC